MLRNCWRAAIFFLIAFQSGYAQKPWFLQNRGYYDPVLAEPRAALTQVLFPGIASSFPFAVNPGRGVVWDISVGKEIPVLGFESNQTQSPAGVPAGSWGFGLWFPLSFHMIEDLGKDPSNPILNTDYRFSGMLKAQYGLGDAGKLVDSRIGLRFQFGHESTHIGDEFTLGALRTHPNDFLRVNVSYEYYDFGASFEPNFGKGGRYRLKLRGGNIWLWHPDNGWYSRDLLQPFGQFIAGSKRNHEPYGQVELLTPSPWTKLNFIVSADIRDRTIYQYNRVPTAAFVNPDEPTQVSLNTMVGVRQQHLGTGRLGLISPTYFIRYYHGVNPNGQFRSQKNFQLIGFGVQLGF
ncbi:MAG TPA: DUF1207 domain-containing protein [Bryobacteraceae bacterium]